MLKCMEMMNIIEKRIEKGMSVSTENIEDLKEIKEYMMEKKGEMAKSRKWVVEGLKRKIELKAECLSSLSLSEDQAHLEGYRSMAKSGEQEHK